MPFAHHTSTGSSATQPTALLVDVDPTTRSTTAAILESVQLQVWAVGDSQTARRLLRRRPVDLIVTDLYVDDLPGEELAAEWLNMPLMDEVPVLFLTTRQIPDIIRRCFGSIGTYHLRKPVDPRVLAPLVLATLSLLPNRATRLSDGHRSLAPPHQLSRSVSPVEATCATR